MSLPLSAVDEMSGAEIRASWRQFVSVSNSWLILRACGWRAAFDFWRLVIWNMYLDARIWLRDAAVGLMK